MYVSGIGGIGVKVVCLLVMLATANVSIKADKIIPILIDSDCRETYQTKNMIDLYSNIHSRIGSRNTLLGKYFCEEIIYGNNIMGPINVILGNNQNLNLMDCISYNIFSKNNQAMANLLFSQTEMTSNVIKGGKDKK